jgi:hypothetical protein
MTLEGSPSTVNLRQKGVSDDPRGDGLSLMQQALNAAVSRREAEGFRHARTSMTLKNRCQKGEVFSQASVFKGCLVQGGSVVASNQGRSAFLGH